MKLTINRFDDNGDRTLGIIYLDGKMMGFTLEDEHRDVKVRKETRIPEGTYTVGIQEYITPLTKKYRSRYSWFTHHLHIKDVPNFTGVYIHIGNTDQHTAGCVLVGSIAYMNSIRQSTVAYKALYTSTIAAAKAGDLTLEIIDIQPR